MSDSQDLDSDNHSAPPAATIVHSMIIQADQIHNRALRGSACDLRTKAGQSTKWSRSKRPTMNARYNRSGAVTESPEIRPNVSAAQPRAAREAVGLRSCAARRLLRRVRLPALRHEGTPQVEF